MTADTHVLGGALAGTAFALCTNTQPLLMTGIAAVAALIPDIDTCTSRMGRKLFPVSLVLQATVGHRTVFHAPLPYIVLSGILTLIFPGSAVYLAAGFIGILSHLLLDLLTVEGIPLLYPLPGRVHLLPIRTRGLGELLVRAVLLVSLFLAYKNILGV